MFNTIWRRYNLRITHVIYIANRIWYAKVTESVKFMGKSFCINARGTGCIRKKNPFELIYNYVPTYAMVLHACVNAVRILSLYSHSSATNAECIGIRNFICDIRMHLQHSLKINPPRFSVKKNKHYINRCLIEMKKRLVKSLFY